MFLEVVKNWKLLKCFAVTELRTHKEVRSEFSSGPPLDALIFYSHTLSKFLFHWNSPAFVPRRFTIRWPWTAENPIKVLRAFNVYVISFAMPVRQFCVDCSWIWLRLLQSKTPSSCNIFTQLYCSEISAREFTTNAITQCADRITFIWTSYYLLHFSVITNAKKEQQ
jgi:hypothetical protein